MKASLRIIVLALFALSITTVAFAADAGEEPLPPDAGTSDAAESDAAASDVIESDIGPESDATESDATESDVVDPEPDATEPPSGQFSESACWDEMCPDQINACKADANCSAYAGCIVNNDGDQAGLEACLTALQGDIGEEAAGAAAELYQAIAVECGWAACATTEGSCAGNCGTYNGADVCNCDGQCWDYGDCCQDICDVCAAENAEECGGGSTCTPDCGGKDCGHDGCGGSCGACLPGESCNADGTCGGGEACQDECTDGEVGCDGDTAWVCGVTSLGCTAYSTTDCAASGQVCDSGACVDPGAADAGAGGDTAAGDTAGGVGTGTDSETGGSSSSGCGGAPSDSGPLGGIIASLLILGLAIRRRA